MKKRSAVIALALCVSLLLVACSGASAIVGKWKYESDAGSVIMEFKADGTVTAESAVNTATGTYTIDGDKITMTGDQTTTGTYKIEGNKLTITANNTTVEFTKQ